MRLFTSLAAITLALFLPAGNWNWSAGWWCLAVHVVGLALFLLLWLRWKNPELLRRRATVGSGTPAWDVALVLLIQWLLLLQLAVASLDQGRHHGGPSPTLWWLGLLLLAAGAAGLCLTMSSNPYFETTVRHQRDQGQRIVTHGPYRLVRHPGYSSALTILLSLSATTGSFWSLAVWLATAGVFSIRCLLEEALLF